MKLLVYDWNSYMQYDLYAILQEQGIAFDKFVWKFEDKNIDEEFDAWFEREITYAEYDAVLSINYWPLLSVHCQKVGVKYIAWCYDAPLNVERIEETLANPVNYVFLFDRIQYWNYKKKGIDTVYHLPLGVNRTRMEGFVASGVDFEKYGSEVSFVGSLYESKLYEVMTPLDDYTKGYLNSLLDAQQQLYGCYIFDDVIAQELIDNINGQYKAKCSQTMFQICKEALIFAMASEVTRRDRLILLGLCGKRYDTKFYSHQDSNIIVGAKRCPAVDYVWEMPKVFACSKININPSLRIIQSGIPLRVFDILGAGGFCLTNYQEEILELFDNGQDLVIYESYEDALAKMDFYLRHEELRQEIVYNGRRKVLEKYSLQQRIAEIFKEAGL